MPISCLTNCLSSSFNRIVISPIMAICRIKADSFTPAFNAFCRMIKYSVLLNRTAVRTSLLMIFAGLPAFFLFSRTASISLYFSVLMTSSFADQREQKRASVDRTFLFDINTARLKN